MPRKSDYVSDADIIKDAIERGVKRKAALLREAGGPLSATDVAALLGLSPEALSATKSLLAVTVDNGELVWPVVLFESAAMLRAVVGEVCAAMKVDNGWAHLNVLFLHLQELNGPVSGALFWRARRIVSWLDLSRFR